MREQCRDFEPKELEAALMHTWTAKITIPALLEAAFDWLCAVKFGGGGGVAAAGEAPPIEAVSPVLPVAPQDDPDGFQYENEAMKRAMEASLQDAAAAAAPARAAARPPRAPVLREFGASALVAGLSGGAAAAFDGGDAVAAAARKVLEAEEKSGKWWRCERGVPGYFRAFAAELDAAHARDAATSAENGEAGASSAHGGASDARAAPRAEGGGSHSELQAALGAVYERVYKEILVCGQNPPAAFEPYRPAGGEGKPDPIEVDSE